MKAIAILHGEDDQTVPIDNNARQAIKLLKNGALKTYPGLPHGMASTHPQMINPDRRPSSAPERAAS